MAKKSTQERKRLKRKQKKLQKRKQKVEKKKATQSDEPTAAGGTLSGMRRGFRDMATGGPESASNLTTIFWVLLIVAIGVFAFGFVRC